MDVLVNRLQFCKEAVEIRKNGLRRRRFHSHCSQLLKRASECRPLSLLHYFGYTERASRFRKTSDTGSAIPLRSFGQVKTLRRNRPRDHRKGEVMIPEQNLQLMKTLDDSWNAKDLTTFRKRHAKDCVVRWPNQPPTHGIEAHEQEALAFFKTFPDQHLVNNPYKVMIAEGDWTCTIAEFTGTIKGPMTMADGKVIAPTNKSFKVDFCTVAHWNENGEIVEENLFYDLMGMLKQIGVM